MPTDSSDCGDLIPFAHPEALTEPDKLLAAYFNSSAVGIAIFNPEFRYIAVNDTLAQINGIPAADHLGKTVREILGTFADAVEPEFQRVLSKREAVNFEISATLPARRENGHWIVQYLPIEDATGGVSRVAAVVVEITAQKRLEESLEQVGGKLGKEKERLQLLSDVGVEKVTSISRMRLSRSMLEGSIRPCSV